MTGSAATSPQLRSSRSLPRRAGHCGWPAVIGNADALLLDLHDGLAPAHTPLPFIRIAQWCIQRLTDEHVRYLRNLPGALRIRAPDAPEVMLVHATPWSIEEIVLRDTPGEVAARMLAAAGDDLLRTMVTGGLWEVASRHPERGRRVFVEVG